MGVRDGKAKNNACLSGVGAISCVGEHDARVRVSMILVAMYLQQEYSPCCAWYSITTSIFSYLPTNWRPCTALVPLIRTICCHLRSCSSSNWCCPRCRRSSLWRTCCRTHGSKRCHHGSLKLPCQGSHRSHSRTIA